MGNACGCPVGESTPRAKPTHPLKNPPAKATTVEEGIPPVVRTDPTPVAAAAAELAFEPELPVNDALAGEARASESDDPGFDTAEEERSASPTAEGESEPDIEADDFHDEKARSH